MDRNYERAAPGLHRLRQSLGPAKSPERTKAKEKIQLKSKSYAHSKTLEKVENASPSAERGRSRRPTRRAFGQYASSPSKGRSCQSDTLTNKSSNRPTSPPANTVASKPSNTLSNRPSKTRTYQTAYNLDGRPAGSSVSKQPASTMTGRPSAKLTSKPSGPQKSRPSKTRTNQPTSVLDGGPSASSIRKHPPSAVTGRAAATMTSKPSIALISNPPKTVISHTAYTLDGLPTTSTIPTYPPETADQPPTEQPKQSSNDDAAQPPKTPPEAVQPGPSDTGKQGMGLTRTKTLRDLPSSCSERFEHCAACRPTAKAAARLPPRKALPRHMMPKSTKSAAQVTSWEMKIPGLPTPEVIQIREKTGHKCEMHKKDPKNLVKKKSLAKRQELSAKASPYPTTQSGLPLINIPEFQPEGDDYQISAIPSSFYRRAKPPANMGHQGDVLSMIDASANISKVNIMLREGGLPKVNPQTGRLSLDMAVQYMHLPKMDGNKMFAKHEVWTPLASVPSDTKSRTNTTTASKPKGVSTSVRSSNTNNSSFPTIIYGQQKERVEAKKGRILPRM